MKFGYLTWFSGLLIGFGLGTVTLWLIHDTHGATYDLIADNFVSVLTVLATVVAAGIALWGVSHQIQSNVVLAEKTRLAKLDAERSVLPIVLSNISELCRERYHALAKGDLEKPAGVIWEMSDLERSTLKSCIEYADEPAKHWLTQIPLIYQVVISRWGKDRVYDLRRRVRTTRPAITLGNQLYEITNWITMQVICESLFKYARAKSSIPDKNSMRKSIISKLDDMGRGTGRDEKYIKINYYQFFEFIKKLNERGKIPYIDVDWDQ